MSGNGIDWEESELSELFPLLPLKSKTEKWGVAIIVLLTVGLITLAIAAP